MCELKCTVSDLETAVGDLGSGEIRLKIATYLALDLRQLRLTLLIDAHEFIQLLVYMYFIAVSLSGLLLFLTAS